MRASHRTSSTFWLLLQDFVTLLSPPDSWAPARPSRPFSCLPIKSLHATPGSQRRCSLSQYAAIRCSPGVRLLGSSPSLIRSSLQLTTSSWRHTVSFHRPLVWVKLVLRCTMGLRIAPLIFFWFCSHYMILSLIVMRLHLRSSIPTNYSIRIPPCDQSASCNPVQIMTR